MLVAEHIAAIRGLIKGYSETDAPYSDEYLYKLFTSAAARLIRQREEKNHKMSDWNTPLYGIKLVADVLHGSSCIAGCQVLRTKYKIPRPVTARSKDLIKVFTGSMEELRYIFPSDFKVIQYDSIYKNKLHYTIINDYIYVFNGDPVNIVPRAIFVSGYFTDPSDWSTITACDEDGTETIACFDINNTEYPLDEDLAYPAYQLVLQLLNISLQLRDDRINQQS